jgi:hypothetical protein
MKHGCGRRRTMSKRRGYGTPGLGTPWWFKLWGVFCILLGLAFWGAVFYVAWHFFTKYW